MITTSLTPSTTATELVSRMLSVLRGGLAAAPAWRARPTSAEHTLPQAHTLTLPASKGQHIDCVQGCLWITQDGDPRDVVLEAGQRFAVDRGQRTLVHALEPARVRVARAPGG